MSKNRSVVFSLTVLCAAAFTGCNQQDPSAPEPDDVDRVGLSPFASCEDVLDYVHEKALEKVGPYGFESEGFGWAEDGFSDGGESGGGDEGGAAGEGGDTGADVGGGAPDHSTTNVQELGVDEPDIVKTDGNRILALAQGQLHYIDLSSGDAVLTGSVQLFPAIDPEYGYYYGGSEMLVQDDRAVVVSRRSAYDVPQAIKDAFGYGPESWEPLTQLIEVDLSDPTNPVVLGNLYLEGDYVSGRQVGETARFVVRAWPPGLAFKYPYDFLGEDDYNYDEFGGGYDQLAFEQAEALAEAHNRGVVAATRLEHWMPRFAQETLQGGGSLTTGQLVACDRAFEPGTFAGLGMLSVLTVDMSNALALQDAVGIFSEGETVYASQKSLYVATWPQYLNLPEPGIERVDGEVEEPEVVSYIHKFDISSERHAQYMASGEVPGHLLDQWAMSEHRDDLRVASTDFGWWSEGSQSFVSVLRQEGKALELVGQVGGIGKDEQIFGVRFIADTGYVVTFRQTDPLFTIDLRDPEKPAVVGELQMPGYSAYLHPIGEGILLGVGRDGDEEGNLGGAELSIFDVSDPANPVRLHEEPFGEEWASSNVEWDHRAFLYWAPEKLVVVPLTSYSWDEVSGTESHFAGAVAYRVDPELGISLAGIIEHEPITEDEWGWSYGGEIQRSLVVGPELFTMSESGLKTSTMSDMVEASWLPF